MASANAERAALLMLTVVDGGRAAGLAAAVLLVAAVDVALVDAVAVATEAVAGDVAGWLSGLTFIWIFPG